MTASLMLRTSRGDLLLRPEREADAAFLLALFRSHALETLAAMPMDAATKEALVRMQFTSATATYRAQYAAARFDIIERDGEPMLRVLEVLAGEKLAQVDRLPALVRQFDADGVAALDYGHAGRDGRHRPGDVVGEPDYP